MEGDLSEAYPKGVTNTTMDDWVRSREVCRILRISPKTLSAWGKRGVIRTIDLPNGGAGKRCHRLYRLPDGGPSAGQRPPTPAPAVAKASPPVVDAVYGRVSTRKQAADLDRQIRALRARHPEATLVFKDIASGINFRRPGLRALLGRALDGGLRHVYVAHRDRLSRLAYDLIEHILQRGGARVVVDANHASTDDTADLADTHPTS